MRQCPAAYDSRELGLFPLSLVPGFFLGLVLQKKENQKHKSDKSTIRKSTNPEIGRSVDHSLPWAHGGHIWVLLCTLFSARPSFALDNVLMARYGNMMGTFGSVALYSSFNTAPCFACFVLGLVRTQSPWMTISAVSVLEEKTVKQ